MDTAMITPPPASPQPAPERSHQQRMDALERANEIRVTRARFKRDVKAGRVQLAPNLLEPPAWLLSAHLWHLLLAMPKVGRVKANRILIHLRVSPSKTVGGLSERQRHELVDHLTAR